MSSGKTTLGKKVIPGNFALDLNLFSPAHLKIPHKTPARGGERVGNKVLVVGCKLYVFNLFPAFSPPSRSPKLPCERQGCQPCNWRCMGSGDDEKPFLT